MLIYDREMTAYGGNEGGIVTLSQDATAPGTYPTVPLQPTPSTHLHVTHWSGAPPRPNDLIFEWGLGTGTIQDVNGNAPGDSAALCT